MYCSGLTSITIPDSVTSIGEDAFSDCTSLTSIIASYDVARVWHRAFYFCTGLGRTSFEEATKARGGDSGSSGGCYIATAVYGSYNCPQVWTLRRYRDNSLARTACGRALIQAYYAMSPSLVKRFGNREWFQRIWKRPLDAFVARLQAGGVENTPYLDRAK
jgi:hypothetical protein